MKIGILTFHNALNYGAVLQCYALQKFLQEKGFEVSVIDYRNRWIEGVYEPFSMYVALRYIKKPRAFAGYIRSINRRKHKYADKRMFYSDFEKKHLAVSERISTKDKISANNYDAIIIGSDQVWGLSCLGGLFDDAYLGCFVHNRTKVIGYAISTDMYSLRKLSEKQDFTNVIERFDEISFRESDYADFINERVAKHVYTCVDPTLLLPSTGWDEIVDDKWKAKNYVAIYQVRYKVGYENYIYDMAKKSAELFGRDCEIIDLNGEYSVEDFVSVIRYAKLVITSSFHATAFSVIFGTKFYSIQLNDGYDTRYVSLLKKLNLTSRLICIGSDIDSQEIVKQLPGYSLQRINSDSVEFLKNSLK